MKQTFLFAFLVAYVDSFEKPWFYASIHSDSAQFYAPFQDEIIANVSVTLPIGTLTGMTIDLGNDKTDVFHGKADIFLGVPFAQPPINSLRFKYPVEIKNFSSNPYLAQKQPNLCPQSVNQETNKLDDNQDEDCLYMNILTPQASSKLNFPVMVFIHGGTFVSGGIMNYGHEGIITNLVSHGIVVVLIQYRIGALGFLTTFTDDMPPNRAMFDQLMALEFIKENIQYFGGDKTQITLVGQSAGAASASAHSYSPLSKDLFKKLILMSGTIYVSMEGSLGDVDLDFDRANKICKITKQEWENRSMKTVNDCFRNADITHFIRLEHTNIYGWKLHIDDKFGKFLPASPVHLLDSRPDLPIMLGTMKNEFVSFLIGFNYTKMISASTFGQQEYEGLFNDIAGYFKAKTQMMLNLCLNFYKPYKTSSTDNLEWIKIADRTITSASFVSTTGVEARWLYDKQFKQIYLYENSYAPSFSPKLNLPGWKEYNPAMHSSDVELLMRQPDKFNGIQFTQTDIQASTRLGNIFADFVKDSTNMKTNYQWTPVNDYDNLNHYAINADATSRMSTTPYRPTDMLMWSKVSSVIMGEWPMGDYTSYDYRFRKDSSSASTTLDKLDNLSEASELLSLTGILKEGKHIYTDPFVSGSWTNICMLTRRYSDRFIDGTRIQPHQLNDFMKKICCCVSLWKKQATAGGDAPAQPKTFSWDKPNVDPAAFICTKLENETVLKPPGSVQGQQFLIDSCKNCIILVQDYTASVMIDDCEDCIIVIGPCKGSIFIRDTKRCQLFAICQQLRTRDCNDISAFIFCTTSPIIEDSTRMRFSQLFINYDKLEEQMENAQMSPFTNSWDKVHDYTPTSGKNSNFAIRNGADYSGFTEALVEAKTKGHITFDAPSSYFLNLIDIPDKESNLILVMPTENQDLGQYYKDSLAFAKVLAEAEDVTVKMTKDLNIVKGDLKCLFMDKQFDKYSGQLLAIELKNGNKMAIEEAMAAANTINSILIDAPKTFEYIKNLYQLAEVKSSV
uniref:C-CAP/cofactor C-like domain-containing protein n=1 Tax=Rhabditophanes sp. KR3021 TaxID=114890 RepID=A0AC35TQE8_9BILA